MLADNYTVIPSAEISHIGWLTKEATLKRASSIVVEFTDPEMANAIIYAGLAWDGLIHQCQLYDRACRVKQCFRCWHYGHIGTQCVASQQCGYCAEPHETRHCQQKGVEGFAPRCAVCKGAHTAWSNACLARKNELERVEAAKRTRDIYWHVPSKERSTRPRTRNTHGESGTQTGQGPITTNQGRNTTQATAETIEDSEPEVDTSSHTDGNAQPLEEHAAMRTRSAPRDERPAEITPVPATAPTALDAEEDWMTPIIDIEPVHQPSPPIDPQIQTTEQSLHTTQTSENNPRQPPECPPDGIERAPAMQQAEDWLDNFITDFDDGWAPGLAATETQSPPTSIVTDPRTAQGATHRGCSCPGHQEIYRNWPISDVEITIAPCMRVCVYCGKYCTSAGNLRRHLRNEEYKRRNVSVRQERKGKTNDAPTPAWTRRTPHTETPALRPELEPSTHPPYTRTTRNQSRANCTDETLR